MAMRRRFHTAELSDEEVEHELRGSQEEGSKDRPSVITLAIERQPDGETLVTVLPITHRPPDDETNTIGGR